MQHPDGARGRRELERKWVMPARLTGRVTRILNARLRPDPEHAEGYVSSIYYDTPDWRFVEEKLSSDFLKTKVRLRWYEDEQRRPLSPQAFLELKVKLGGAREKLRVPSPIDAGTLLGMDLTDRRLRQLPRLAGAEGVRLPVPLLPAFLVRYRRRRYVDPISGLRLSLDDRIHVPAVNRGLVPPSRHTHLDLAILEVKGERGDLPRTLRPLFELGLRQRSLSKYAACHTLLMDPCPAP